MQGAPLIAVRQAIREPQSSHLQLNLPFRHLQGKPFIVAEDKSSSNMSTSQWTGAVHGGGGGNDCACSAGTPPTHLHQGQYGTSAWQLAQDHRRHRRAASVLCFYALADPRKLAIEVDLRFGDQRVRTSPGGALLLQDGSAIEGRYISPSCPLAEA